MKLFLRLISPLKGEPEGALNARLYDPVVGKMLSPDMVVQAPDFTQSYNRYSYAFNNPLKFTDPTGNVVTMQDLQREMDESSREWFASARRQYQNAFYRPDRQSSLTYNWDKGHYERGGEFVSTAFAMGTVNSMSTPMNWHEELYKRSNTASTYVDSKRNPIDGSPIGAIIFDTRVVLDGAQGNGGGGFNIDMVSNIAGAVGVNMNVKEGLIEFAKKSGDIGKTGEKYLSFTKAASKMMGVTGAVTSWMDYNKNPSTGALVKAFANTGLIFLRVNPFVGVGLGVLDLTGGSDWIYNQVGNGIDNMGGPRR